MAIVQEHQTIDVFVISDGLVNLVQFHVVATIIRRVWMDQEFVINVNIGRKVNRVKNVDQEAMEMQHQSNWNVDLVNVMDMEMKHSASVTYKQVNVSVNTTPKETIAKSVAQIITGVQLMVVNVISSANHVEC